MPEPSAPPFACIKLFLLKEEAGRGVVQKGAALPLTHLQSSATQPPPTTRPACVCSSTSAAHPAAPSSNRPLPHTNCQQSPPTTHHPPTRLRVLFHQLLLHQLLHVLQLQLLARQPLARSLQGGDEARQGGG